MDELTWNNKIIYYIMENEALSLVFIFAALGQSVLAVSIIVPRLKKIPVYLPLLLFFISTGVAYSVPAVNSLWPNLTYLSLFVFLPTIAIQPMSLWIYVVGLTSTNKWQFSWRYWPHLMLPLLALLLSGYMLALPKEVIEGIFVYDLEPQSIEGLIVVISFLVLFIAFMVQSTGYLIAVIRRLLTYQQQLKMLFSSNEGRELFWVLWLVLIIASTWFLALLHILPPISSKTPMISSDAVSICYFLMIWTLSVWGLRQKPGFEERYIDDDDLVKSADITRSEDNAVKAKYKRSALGNDQAKSIALKLDHAMKDQQLFLAANLSLPELSKQLTVPANYISQTLNEYLNESFFDYVNRWRVEYAKTLLVEGKLSVIDVAMESGFNAKSSFYKAFKKYTGTTPGQYLK